MRKLYCTDCKVRLLVGTKLAWCENCNKFYDLAKKRRIVPKMPKRLWMAILFVATLIFTIFLMELR